MGCTENSYAYFKNTSCKFYPCHKGADPDHFNCLFCYCPLYTLGDRCGGSFVYLNSGIKDCSNCIKPHCKGNYDRIMSKMGEVMELAKK